MSETRYHIEAIPDKCRACRRCEIACIAAHHGLTFKEATKRRDELVARMHVIKDEGFKTTVRCHQCNPAPCVAVCPMTALQQAANGEIIMRVQFCAGCKMCIQVCPYGAIDMEHLGMPGEGEETMAQRARKDVAVRCDMCKAWRMSEGKKLTACVEACPARALSMVGSDGSVRLPPPPPPKAKGEHEDKAEA
jgi:carbon-monoxide dehydrogenase iron sulfur subunit